MNETQKSKSTTSPFILTLIILLGFIVGYFYYSLVGEDISYEVPVPQELNDPDFLSFKTMNFDSSLFSNDSFKALKPVGNINITPGTTGKNDIFAPL